MFYKAISRVKLHELGSQDHLESFEILRKYKKIY